MPGRTERYTAYIESLDEDELRKHIKGLIDLGVNPLYSQSYPNETAEMLADDWELENFLDVSREVGRRANSNSE